jgi:hypothetical protein
MFIKPVDDPMRTFGIVGGNHLGALATVKKQQVKRTSLIPITEISPALTPNQQ